MNIHSVREINARRDLATFPWARLMITGAAMLLFAILAFALMIVRF